MKTKKFSKKLSLNKKTIANLSDDVMAKAYGGHDETGFTHCDTVCPRSCGTESVCFCPVP